MKEISEFRYHDLFIGGIYWIDRINFKNVIYNFNKYDV